MPNSVSKGSIRRVVSVAYMQRFSGSNDIHIEVWNVDFPSLDIDSLFSFEELFTNKGVLGLLEIQLEKKILYSNGFSFKFVQSFWHVFKDELMALFHSFHSLGNFDSRFSEAFISLISKIKSLVSLNYFRLIFLLDWVYKLIAKVLLRRLHHQPTS